MIHSTTDLKQRNTSRLGRNEKDRQIENDFQLAQEETGKRGRD
jgi:hypothetical protein